MIYQISSLIEQLKEFEKRGFDCVNAQHDKDMVYFVPSTFAMENRLKEIKDKFGE